MNTDTNWQLILAIIGAASGLLAYLRWVIQDIRNFKRRPKLVIFSGPSVGTWGSPWIFATFEVQSKNGQIARECEAKVRITKHPNGVSPLQEEFGLHWADVPYDIPNALTTGTVRVDIGAAPRRLDVAFTMSEKNENTHERTFIAMPLALNTRGNAPKAALPEGDYDLEVMVFCENGSRDKKKIRLTSPLQLPQPKSRDNQRH